jgi:hypothetical protein
VFFLFRISYIKGKRTAYGWLISLRPSLWSYFQDRNGKKSVDKSMFASWEEAKEERQEEKSDRTEE